MELYCQRNHELGLNKPLSIKINFASKFISNVILPHSLRRWHTFFQIYQKWPKRERNKRSLQMVEQGVLKINGWESLSQEAELEFILDASLLIPRGRFSEACPLASNIFTYQWSLTIFSFSTRVGLPQLFLFLFYHCISDALVGGSR